MSHLQLLAETASQASEPINFQTALHGRHRIISVGEIIPKRQAWSAEGRRQVFSSHKVR
jgi:hypothetical protein